MHDIQERGENHMVLLLALSISVLDRGLKWGQSTLVPCCFLSVGTETNWLVRSSERNSHRPHESLPSATHTLLMAHPNHGPSISNGKVDCSKELGQEFNIKILVEQDDVADPKLLTKSQSRAKVILMGPQILQAD